MKIIVEGLNLNEISKQYCIPYSAVYSRYHKGGKRTIAELTTPPVVNENAQLFFDKYGVTISEYARKNGQCASAVSRRFKETGSARRDKSKIINGKTIKQWMKLSGYTYNQVASRANLRGPNMTLEELMEPLYEKAKHRKAGPKFLKSEPVEETPRQKTPKQTRKENEKKVAKREREEKKLKVKAMLERLRQGDTK